LSAAVTERFDAILDISGVEVNGQVGVNRNQKIR